MIELVFHELWQFETKNARVRNLCAVLTHYSRSSFLNYVGLRVKVSRMVSIKWTCIVTTFAFDYDLLHTCYVYFPISYVFSYLITQVGNPQSMILCQLYIKTHGSEMCGQELHKKDNKLLSRVPVDINTRKKQGKMSWLPGRLL